MSVNAQAADTSTTGVKLSTTIPAGSTGTVTQASIFDIVGTTQKLTLEIKRGAVVTSIVTLTASGTINPGIQLLAGDTIQWDCTSAVALSTTDLAISVMLTPITSRVSLGFQGAAILDQGITLHPGNAPVVLLGEHIGQAIREDITAIAAFAGTAISGLDIFEVDCPCNPDTMWKQ